MDREREQFSPESCIVKKYWLFWCWELRSFPNYRNGIDQEIFFLHRKDGKSGKKGSVILAGMGRVSYVKIHIRYELCWNFYPYWNHRPIWNFLKIGIPLNMSELGGGELCMLASLFQNRILNTNDITIRN